MQYMNENLGVAAGTSCSSRRKIHRTSSSGGWPRLRANETAGKGID